MTTLAKALAEAQAAMPAVEPDALNPHFKSKFVSLDHLIAKTRPVLNAHGLSIVQMPAVSDLGQPVLRTTLLHESGESMSADAPLFLPQQDMQKLGAAITYARRYAWAAACGIASEEDDDGTSASRPSGSGSAAKPKNPPPGPQPAGAAAKPPAGGDVTALEAETIAAADAWAAASGSETLVPELRKKMALKRGQANYADLLAQWRDTYRELLAGQRDAERIAKEWPKPEKGKAA